MLPIIISILIITTLIQIYFWIIQLDSLNRYGHSIQEQGEHQNLKPSVNLIIAVKNEKENLKKNLKSWLEQDYQDLKIIIVNDHSEDGSHDLLEKVKDERLTILNLPEGLNGKKAALTYAIEQSSVTWIVITDADCRPQGVSWISSLMQKASKADVILGYSPSVVDKTWLSRWINYEHWYVAMQYLSAGINDRAYMAVGRNLAYKRSAFQAVEGFQSHAHVKSGDDDLFINDLNDSVTYAVSLDKHSWVWTDPKASVQSYIDQKRRHLTTAPVYRLGTKIWLIVIFFSQFFWYLSAIWLCIIYPWLVSVLILRYLMISFVALRSKRHLDLGIHPLLVAFYDLVVCMFYSLMSFTFLWPKKEW